MDGHRASAAWGPRGLLLRRSPAASSFQLTADGDRGAILSKENRRARRVFFHAAFGIHHHREAVRGLIFRPVRQLGLIGSAPRAETGLDYNDSSKLLRLGRRSAITPVSLY